jgi:predicted outer membrane repeat protein
MCWKDGGNGSVSGASTLFSGNTATNNGGAVFISAGDNDQPGDPDVGSSPQFSDCVFSGNSTDEQDGGAVNCKQSGSNPTFTDCVFVGNVSARWAGAIQCDGSATMGLSSCVFADNTANSTNENAPGAGGAIRCDNKDTHITIQHCTLLRNHTTTVGGAILRDRGHVEVEDSILWGNTAGSDGSQIFGTTTVTYSDVQGTEIWPGTGNINDDPLFHDTSNLPGDDNNWFTIDDGLVLQSGSPCLGKGSEGTDMGAYQD